MRWARTERRRRPCSRRCGRRPPSRRRSSGSGRAIRLGLLAPGSRLPPERELARKLRDLALDPAPGADDAGPERPPRLAPGPRRRHLRRRAAAARRAGPASSLDEAAWAVLDYRVAIEAGAVLLAAERASAEQLDRLEELTAKMAGEADDFEEYRRTDIRFHIGLAEAAGSPRLVSAMTEVQGADERPDRADRPPARGPDPLQRPAPAAGRGCCAAATPRGAVRLMREHIEGTEHILAGLLPGRCARAAL